MPLAQAFADRESLIGLNALNAIVAGAQPQTRWGAYSTPPNPLGLRGLLLKGGEGKKREEKGIKGEGS